MNFSQFFILWALPLCLIPLLIHLLNRLRYRTVKWGAMWLLERANKNSTRINKLKQFLILLFRILALATLILAIARPIFSGWLGFAFSGTPDTVLILIDRSASMQGHCNSGRTRFEQAIHLITSSAQALGKNPRYALMDSLTQTVAYIPDPSVIQDRPETLPSDGGANFPSMLTAAYEFIASAQDSPGKTEIWIASDMQKSSWAPEDSVWEQLESKFKNLSNQPKIRIFAVDSQIHSDLSISLVSVVSQPTNNNKVRHEISYVIHQGDEKEQTLPLTFFDSVNKRTFEVALKSSSNRFRYTFETENTNSIQWSYIDLPADINNANNRIYFCYGKPCLRKTLIVGPISDQATKILELAANPIAQTHYQVQQVPFNTFRENDLKEVSLLIWNAPAPAEKMQKVLQSFIEDGGSVLSIANKAGKWFDNIEIAESAPLPEPMVIGEWNHIDGIFANTDSGESLSLDQLKFIKRFTMTGNFLPIATFADNQAYAAQLSMGFGSFILLASSPHPEDSNLGHTGTVIIPMVQRLLDLGTQRMASYKMDICGRDLTFFTNIKQIDAMHTADFSDITRQIGVYNCDGHVIGLNRPTKENELEILSIDTTSKLLGSIKMHTFLDKSGGTESVLTEVWRVFLALMLILLVLEAFLLVPPKPLIRENK